MTPEEPRDLRSKITSWLLFAILVEGVIMLTILLGVAIYRLLNQ